MGLIFGIIHQNRPIGKHEKSHFLQFFVRLKFQYKVMTLQ